MPFQSGLKYQKYIQFRFLFHRITTEIVIGCSKDDKSASKVKYSRRNFIINRSDVYLSCIRTCQDLSIFFQISKFIFYRYFHQYYIINNIINILTGPNTVEAFIQPSRFLTIRFFNLKAVINNCTVMFTGDRVNEYTY